VFIVVFHRFVSQVKERPMGVGNLGIRVRDARKARDLSQEALAREAGVSLNLVNKLERGVVTDPHYSTISGLARALEMTVEELLEEPAPAGKAEAPDQGPAEEEGERLSLAAIRALRAYFWDLRLRWLERDHKPTPEQIRDALDLLRHLQEKGTFEGARTASERFEVQFLLKAAWQLQPIAEELAGLVGSEEGGEDLRQMVDDVYAGVPVR
jgi:transcriptional regulator with XRE-family HTH domain